MAGSRVCCLDSVVHGYHIHVYQCIWTPVIGEQLDVVYEDDNEHNARAVAVMKVTLLSAIESGRL